VKSEDEVLYGVCSWAEANEGNVSHEDLNEVMENINWPYISLKGMVNALRLYSGLKSNPVFTKQIKYELKR
jgi:hypothetical protein